MDRVYLLQHSHARSADADEVKVIGVYRTRDDALAAVARLRGQPGFRNHPHVVNPDLDSGDEGFHVSEMVLGKDSWVDGFISWAEACKEG